MSKTINVVYQDSNAINLTFDLASEFANTDASNITSVKWSFKKSRHDADDAILLKELGSGVTKTDVIEDDGTEKVRLSLNLTSSDWEELSENTTYLLAIGIKLNSHAASDKHTEIRSERKGRIYARIIEDVLRA